MVASHIDALIPQGTPRWNAGRPLGSSVVLTYSFLRDTPGYYPHGAEERHNFVALNSTQRRDFDSALQAWSNVANISFQEVSAGQGVLNVGTARLDPNAGAHAYYPGNWSAAGDIWFNNRYAASLDLTEGTYGFQTALHEIGHALGLEHSHDGDTLPEATDSFQYTLMSYEGHPDMPGVYPTTPMLYDIAAIQYLYGANMSHNAGGNRYSWRRNETFIETIWDAGGDDTIDASNQTRSSRIDLRAGKFSSIGSYYNQRDAVNNLAIAFNVTIENAEGGSGDDTIYGNPVANVLQGNRGNDTIYGFGGNDSIYGGRGDDYLDSGSPSQYFTGNAYLSGDAGNDTLIGGRGNDILSGGSGNDSLMGHKGDDELFGDSGNDHLDGQDGDDLLMGHSGDDTLIGGKGRDRLDGYGTGGTEYDTLTGGAGGDTFVLGGAWGVSYQGSGYATITDWDWLSDFIEVRGSADQYSLRRGNWTGSGLLDTAVIYGSGDFLGIISDSTNVNLNRDFLFV